VNKPSPKAKPDLLKRLRQAFSGLSRCPILKLRDAYQLVGESVRVPYEGFPMELILGKDGKHLRLYPEYPLQRGVDGEKNPGQSDQPPCFVLEDPDHDGTTIGGFLRLEPGEKVTLGRDDPQ